MESHGEKRIITPQEAAVMLESNIGNRNCVPQDVDRIARDLANGDWRFTGDAIKFAESGLLLDGQHRLKACVQAGIPIETMVVYGVPEDARDAMDVHRRRRLSDYLQWRGEANTANLSSACLAAMTWDHQGAPIVRGTKRSHAELLKWLDDNPDIREAVKRANVTAKKPLGFPSSVAAPFFMRIWRVSPMDAEVFYDALRTGADLGEKDPIFRLRRWLMRATAAKGRMDREEHAAVAVKAWNFWLRGREVTNLVWRSGGATKEAFPMIETPDHRTYDEIMADPTYVPPTPDPVERMEFSSDDTQEPPQAAAG